MKKLACVAIALLLVVLPCLSLCGCDEKPAYTPAALRQDVAVEQQFDLASCGTLDMQKAPYVLADGTALEAKRLTKLCFASNSVQDGQTLSLYTFDTDDFANATKATITLDGNYTVDKGVVSVDLSDVVVWVGRGQQIAFFDTNDTVEVTIFAQQNATSVTDGSAASVPLALYTHQYAKQALRLSVLGDSISTFDGVSNDTSANSTLAFNKQFYPRFDIVSSNQTWWQLTTQMTGMSVLVNNSWSGSLVTKNTGRAWQSRCQNLHNDKANVSPDVIALYMGTNDLGQVEVGRFGKLKDVYNEDTGYVTPQTFAQAYAICVHKMKTAYPNAKIFVFTLPQSSYSVDESMLQQFNDIIGQIANYFDCVVVDLMAMDGYHYTTHTSDNLHPNRQGMLCIADYFARCVEAAI